MKRSEIINANYVLQEIGQTKMNQKLAYFVARNILYLEPEMKIFEEARVKLLNEYGTKTGNEVTIPDEKKADVDKEFNELLGIEVTIPHVHKIKMNDFGNFEIAPAQLLTIMWMIDEDPLPVNGK
jgi:hypothetical protein